MTRVFLVLAALAALAAAQGGKCTCLEGNASYLFLRCPKAPPADPDPCPATHDGMHPNKNPPKAWNNACWLSPRMACFLRRHAASWRITCSLCLKKKCCPYPNWHNCPECHGEAKPHENPDHEQLMKVLAQQKQIGGKYIDYRSIGETSSPNACRKSMIGTIVPRSEMMPNTIACALGTSVISGTLIISWICPISLIMLG